jgi:H+/Cl- antiporter ClcA
VSEPSPAHEPDTAPAGRIGDDAQAVLDAARATAGAYAGTFTALRRLFAAEVGLARDALVHALVYLLVATVMLGTAYLLLTALVVSGLRALGAPWPLAILLPLLLSVGVAALGVLRMRAMLKFADFEATRRQLKRDFGTPPDEDAAP